MSENVKQTLWSIRALSIHMEIIATQMEMIAILLNVFKYTKHTHVYGTNDFTQN